MRHLIRKAAWTLFWLVSVVALLVVLLFVLAAVPVLGALAQGGYGRIWFSGNSGFVVLASALYLVLVAVIFAKKRSQGASHRLGT